MPITKSVFYFRSIYITKVNNNVNMIPIVLWILYSFNRLNHNEINRCLSKNTEGSVMNILLTIKVIINVKKKNSN